MFSKCVKSHNFYEISTGRHIRDYYGSKSDYKMHNIFKIFYLRIISKYNLECTQLNHIFKIFSEEYTRAS